MPCSFGGAEKRARSIRRSRMRVLPARHPSTQPGRPSGRGNEDSMSAPTNTAVSEYLNRTQAALADLPAAEVEEILEDIGPHLAEVADELGEGVSVETLIERLGTPEDYASELRTAAGYPPAETTPKPAGVLLSRLALWLLTL